MQRHLLAFGLALVLSTVALAGVVSAHPTGSSGTYVGAGALEHGSTQTGFAACVQGNNVGGVCQLSSPDGSPSVEVTVEDEALGERAFAYRFFDHTGQRCSQLFTGESGDTITFPAGCPHVDVYVQAPATTGTVSLSPAS